MRIRFAASMMFILLICSIPNIPTWAVASSTVTETPQACVRYADNPVLTQSPFPGSNGTFRESVILNGKTFDMWYTVEVGAYLAIGFATSANGFNWSSSPGPILQHGVNGSWDAVAVYSPSVIWNGSYYLMYFTGVRSSVSTRSIGLAFSKDMIHWQEYAGNPVLVPGPGTYDSSFVRSSDVLYDGHSYQMWYSGAPTNNATYPVAIDYATSLDGIHWTKYAHNPLLTGNGWPAGADTPSVVRINQTYVMAFGTSDITYATSYDGIHWSWSGFQLLAGTNIPSNWEDTVIDPSIVIVNSSMLLWYAGVGYWTPPQPPAPRPAIGLAYCSLVLLPSTNVVSTTVTSVKTSIVIATETVTSTSSTVRMVATSEPPVYELASGILAASLVVTLVLLYKTKRPRG
jgi:predicted GH43/DUF377 family glycosyl hydrolase